MKYPTFKVRGAPTPNEKLVVCEICQTAAWTIHSTGQISYCCGRMREGTPQEYNEARLALTTIF